MVKIYPNPSPGKFYLNILPSEHPLLVKVVSEFGQQVYCEKYSFAETGFNEEVDLSNHETGTYFVEILSNSKFEMHQIVIAR